MHGRAVLHEGDHAWRLDCHAQLLRNILCSFEAANLQHSPANVVSKRIILMVATPGETNEEDKLSFKRWIFEGMMDWLVVN